MAQKRRDPGKGKEKAPSPLDAKQRELAEEEAKLRSQIEENQKVISEAPQRAKEMERRRREELINRASRTESRPGSRVALPDRRFGSELNVAIPARQKSLRAERNQGRLLFFALLFALAAVVYWAYWTFTHP